MSTAGQPDSTTTRLAIAEDDVRIADATDLASASGADLIALVVRLRGSLADVIRICRDLEHP